MLFLKCFFMEDLFMYNNNLVGTVKLEKSNLRVI